MVPCTVTVAFIQLLNGGEKKVGCRDRYAFNFKFNLILTRVLHSISNWSRIKLVKAEIDLEENNSWLMCVCAGMHPHTDRESICLSWHWAGVDGIDLDLSHSFLHSAPPPPLLSHFVFLRGCHSQSHSANHLSRRLQSAGGILAFSVVAVFCQGSSTCPG